MNEFVSIFFKFSAYLSTSGAEMNALRYIVSISVLFLSILTLGINYSYKYVV